MVLSHRSDFLIVGAGAAGLMAARELVRAGKRVTVLEARQRCGGRIYALPAEEFGYPAEGGAEFVHGEASVTRTLMREARLSLSPRRGRRWTTRSGTLSPADGALPHAKRFYRALQEVEADLPIADFLETYFPVDTMKTCGARSREPSRAMTPRTRAASVPSHYVTSGWLATMASTAGSREAMAR
jgi:glycine/D-amino acid oxidase-like deaminating enzyme